MEMRLTVYQFTTIINQNQQVGKKTWPIGIPPRDQVVDGPADQGQAFEVQIPSLVQNGGGKVPEELVHLVGVEDRVVVKHDRVLADVTHDVKPTFAHLAARLEVWVR